MNWITPKLEDLKEGLRCQIIDMAKSHEYIAQSAEVKRHFKREVATIIIYKDHILTDSDILYYTLNPQLIKRDIKILQEENEETRE